MPYHVLLDTAGEAQARQAARSAPPGAASAPVTPTRPLRLGIRVQDLLDEKILRKKIMTAMEPKQQTAAPVRRATPSSTCTR